MKKVLNEIAAPGGNWTNGPYTLTGSANAEKPLTLLDLLKGVDGQHPNNIRAPQRLPAPGDSLFEQLVTFWENVQEMKYTIIQTLKNPTVQENKRLHTRAVHLYELLRDMESKIKDIDKILKDFTITDNENETSIEEPGFTR